VTKSEARRICRLACGCSNEAVGVSPTSISHQPWCMRSRYVMCAAYRPVYSRCVKAKGNGELPCLLRSCNESRAINYSTLNCKCTVYTELQFDLCCWRYVYVGILKRKYCYLENISQARVHIFVHPYLDFITDLINIILLILKLLDMSQMSLSSFTIIM
jgi:hypothetical protein